MNTIKTWCFDLITGEYTGTYNAPKDSKSLGRYQIPAFATTIEPPAPAENQKVVWDGQAWQLENIPGPELDPEPTEEDLLQQEISILEGMAHERYDAFVKLMATDAPQEEIDVLKWELQVIIQELGALRNEA